MRLVKATCFVNEKKYFPTFVLMRIMLQSSCRNEVMQFSQCAYLAHTNSVFSTVKIETVHMITMLNPIPVNPLADQSKPGHAQRHSGKTC